MTLREVYTELPSTQDRAVQLAREGAEEGVRVVARLQTAGRGRLDHTWHSPPGGLYFSLVLAAPHPSPLLPLALGARVLESFRDRYGVPGALKWPNDLFAALPGSPGRKLGGIIVDRVDSPTLGTAAVAGIGINVSRSPSSLPPELPTPMAFLDEFVRPPPPLAELEGDVAAIGIETARRLRTPDGTGSARRLCRDLLYGVGRPAVVDGRLRGRIDGLGDDGELWISTGEGRVAIRAGDLRVEDVP